MSTLLSCRREMSMDMGVSGEETNGTTEPKDQAGFEAGAIRPGGIMGIWQQIGEVMAKTREAERNTSKSTKVKSAALTAFLAGIAAEETIRRRRAHRKSGDSQ